jgi:hypothetical protein
MSIPLLALNRFLDSGGVYKLAFGPKAFIVVSDPVVVRHLLKVGCHSARYCTPNVQGVPASDACHVSPKHGGLKTHLSC